MARLGCVFKIFLLILIGINVDGARQSRSVLGSLSQLIGKRSRSPVIVVVDSSGNYNGLLRSGDDRNQDKLPIDDRVNEKNTLQYVSEILRSTGDQNDPKVQATNEKFEKALRSRCSSLVECKQECKPKKKNCVKSCKAVFDSFNLCDKPKPTPKKSCGNGGSTMPPKW